MRYGSVCAGIGSVDVAWEGLGWKTVAFAEVADFPSAVLAHHWPDVPNDGDLTTIVSRSNVFRRWKTVELLVGGTPCTDFSTAGKKKRLKGDNGRLALDFVDLAHALADKGSLRWILWENVPGVLQGHDNAFGHILGRLVGHDGPIPRPDDRPWPNAGLASGPWGRAAWRVLDSKHFGVPQRRPRLFLVGCPGTRGDPAAVLFERGAGDRRVDVDVGGRPAGLPEAPGPQHLPVPPVAQLLPRGQLSAPHLLGPIAFDAAKGEIAFSATVLTRGHGRKGEIGVLDGFALRRFVPSEWERLQGFPTGHTAIRWRDKPASDSARTGALGDAMAVPVMRWLGERLDAADKLARGEAELAPTDAVTSPCRHAVMTAPAAPVPQKPREELHPTFSVPAGERTKVTVYAHRKLATAVRKVALDQGRAANDVYLEALDRYLKAEGVGGVQELAGN